MNTYIVTMHAVVSAAAWFVFGCGAAYAVFSPKVRDTVAERIALSCISIFAFATTARVIKQGWISEGGLLLSVALASYVCIIIYKHWKGGKCSVPRDKARSVPMEPTWRQDAHL